MPTAVWERSPEVLWRWSPDGALVLPPSVADPMVFDGTASAVWDLLEIPSSLEELVEQLADHFQAPRAAVAQDVTAFLARLENLGAVQCRR